MTPVFCSDSRRRWLCSRTSCWHSLAFASAGIGWRDYSGQRWIRAHARSALRKTVHIVRSSLGADAIVPFGDEELVIGPAAPWCDAGEFTTSVEAGLLGRALELHRVDLMPGFHLPECGELDRGLEEERAATPERVVAAAWALARECEENDRLTDAGSASAVRTPSSA